MPVRAASRASPCSKVEGLFAIKSGGKTLGYRIPSSELFIIATIAVITTITFRDLTRSTNGTSEVGDLVIPLIFYKIHELRF